MELFSNMTSLVLGSLEWNRFLIMIPRLNEKNAVNPNGFFFKVSLMRMDVKGEKVRYINLDTNFWLIFSKGTF